MTFQLPTYTSPAEQGWQLIDYKPKVIVTATAGADGTATATAAVVEPGRMWAVQRAVVSSTSTKAPQCRLYDGPASLPNLMSGTDSGSFDEAEYPAGIGMLVDQGGAVTAVWAGCSPGAVCTLRLQVAVLALPGA